jgi:hypothetical protein
MDQLAQLEAEAHRINDEDDNAARYYHYTATTRDLAAWLTPPVSNAAGLADEWTRGRRIRQMQAELAGRLAELCMRPEHFDAFGDPPNEDADGHVAAHLAMLTAGK